MAQSQICLMETQPRLRGNFTKFWHMITTDNMQQAGSDV